jgi:hypothetical protein
MDKKAGERGKCYLSVDLNSGWVEVQYPGDRKFVSQIRRKGRYIIIETRFNPKIAEYLLRHLDRITKKQCHEPLFFRHSRFRLYTDDRVEAETKIRCQQFGAFLDEIGSFDDTMHELSVLLRCGYSDVIDKN